MAPTLPPLYFSDASLADLPSELLAEHVLSFLDWGDWAKMASTQSAWSSLLTDAAAQSQEATWELAQALLEGTHGLAPNPSRALSLLESLASEDVAPAMKQLARCYLEGYGVDADAARGQQWLEEAHTRGKDSDAAHEMALLFEYGKHGVVIDVIAAAEWFHKAAEAGHVEAMAELGLCYELGCGVEQSDEQAIEWYMKAAEQGHLTAKYSVGEAFEEARGVPQSDEEACLWYYKAAIEGDEDSRKALRRLEDIARIVVPGVGALLNV